MRSEYRTGGGSQIGMEGVCLVNVDERDKGHCIRWEGQVDRTEQNRTGQDRTGQDRTGQDRTGEDRTGQDRTGQDRTGQDRTGKDRTRQDRTGQDRTGQDRTGQDRTGQDRTGQDRTGQDWTGLSCPCPLYTSPEPTRLRRISYAVFCLKTNRNSQHEHTDILN